MFSHVLERLNERREAAGDAGDDAGFTLIELMVVLLILAILLAIAIPTFLGVTSSANDRAAQSNLNTALTNAKAAYQNAGQTYAGMNAATLTPNEPSLKFLDGSATTNGTVSTANSEISVYAPGDGNSLVLAAFSPKTLNCWVIVDNTGPEGSAAVPYVAPVGVSTTPGTYYYKFTMASTAVNSCNAENPGIAPTATGQQGKGFPPS